MSQRRAAHVVIVCLSLLAIVLSAQPPYRAGAAVLLVGIVLLAACLAERMLPETEEERAMPPLTRYPWLTVLVVGFLFGFGFTIAGHVVAALLALF